jgi:hypothetical protein
MFGRLEVDRTAFTVSTQTPESISDAKHQKAESKFSPSRLFVSLFERPANRS